MLKRLAEFARNLFAPARPPLAGQAAATAFAARLRGAGLTSAEFARFARRYGAMNCHYRGAPTAGQDEPDGIP